MKRTVRRTAAAAAALACVLLGVTASPAQAHNNHHSHPTVTIDALLCIPQLLAPATTGATLTKSITGAENNGDGTYTISFDYTTSRPNGVYGLRDCAFKDTADNGAYNALADPVVGTTNANVVSLVGGSGSSSITVVAVSGDTVCDRLTLSGTTTTDRSNIACIQVGDAEMPAGAIGAVGLVALSAGAFGFAYWRNRRAHPTHVL